MDGPPLAEYLTSVATSLLLVPEVGDLSDGASSTGVALLALSLAVDAWSARGRRQGRPGE